jgi:hypothetical protein
MNLCPIVASLWRLEILIFSTSIAKGKMGVYKRASRQLSFRRVFSAESLDTGRLPNTDLGSVSDLALGAHLKLVSLPT